MSIGTSLNKKIVGEGRGTGENRNHDSEIRLNMIRKSQGRKGKDTV
jgi:hypothetical protein